MRKQINKPGIIVLIISFLYMCPGLYWIFRGFSFDLIPISVNVVLLSCFICLGFGIYFALKQKHKLSLILSLIGLGIPVFGVNDDTYFIALKSAYPYFLNIGMITFEKGYLNFHVNPIQLGLFIAFLFTHVFYMRGSVEKTEEGDGV